MSPPSHPVQGDPFSGQRLGRYDVHCRLTVGGMSDVLLASTRGAGGFRRLVVLKQILPDIKRNPDFVRMFLNEARMMALFSHPHIAQVYDLDVFEDELFLAMEFVPGATLIEVAQACHRAREHIPVGLTLMAVRDTARALHHAHTFTDPAGKPLPVVHRDVTQRNIMLTYDGVTKLLDFGIAKLPDRTALTAVGTIKGTSGYLSPEQIAGEHPDHRSDIFSLGVVLHECLTGLRLFPGRNMVDAMRATLETEIPPPSSKNPAIPTAVDAVVLRALAKKREDRQGSALELAQALETAVPSSIWRPEDASVLLKQLFKQRHADVSRLLADFTVALDDLSDPRIRKLVGLTPLTPSRGSRVGSGVRPAIPSLPVEARPPEALPAQPPVLVPPPVL
ncbi:MAG TPA: serine/threonine-protein kinase, partial [Myxococcaceae bacterium]|nr:serine/threonine-protein kinase [Myxococcaceae bacterium]